MTLMAVSSMHFPILIAAGSAVVDFDKEAGAAISTALWTGMFRNMLAEHLPNAQQPAFDNTCDIFGSHSSHHIGIT